MQSIKAARLTNIRYTSHLCVLAPCFIYGKDIFTVFNINAPQWLFDYWFFPRMGVTGAAVGTTIGRGLGVLLAVSYLLRKSGRITIHKEHWKPDFEIMSNLVKIAAPRGQAECSGPSSPHFQC